MWHQRQRQKESRGKHKPLEEREERRGTGFDISIHPGNQTFDSYSIQLMILSIGTQTLDRIDGERRERWSTFLNIPNEKFEANLVGGELISGNRVVFSALPNWMPHSHFLQVSRFSSQFNFHKIDEAEFEKIKSKKWLRKDRNSKRRKRQFARGEKILLKRCLSPLSPFLPSILQTADWILAAKLETVQRGERKRSRKRTYEKRIIAGKKQGKGRKQGVNCMSWSWSIHTHHIHETWELLQWNR